MTGRILSGGGDYVLGASRDARCVLAPNNGEFIIARHCGSLDELTTQFEAKADGDYAFLNANAFVSSISNSGPVTLTVYERR